MICMYEFFFVFVVRLSIIGGNHFSYVCFSLCFVHLQNFFLVDGIGWPICILHISIIFWINPKSISPAGYTYFIRVPFEWKCILFYFRFFLFHCYCTDQFIVCSHLFVFEKLKIYFESTHKNRIDYDQYMGFNMWILNKKNRTMTTVQELYNVVCILFILSFAHSIYYLNMSNTLIRSTNLVLLLDTLRQLLCLWILFRFWLTSTLQNDWIDCNTFCHMVNKTWKWLALRE